MIKGIGTDLLEIKKLSPIFSQENYLADSFVRRIYTQREIAIAESRSNPFAFYATRFAGKEAAFKALNITGEDCRLSEIEILSDEIGKPYVVLHGNARLLAQKRKISRFLISLSYEDEYALAYAVAE